MNGSRALSSVSGPTDNLSIEDQFSSMSIDAAIDNVHQATDLVEASSKEQFRNVIGQHVSKKFAELMYDGVVESHDNEMFKVVYTNGHSEQMRWEDLIKYLVPHEQPLHPYTNELENNASRDHETSEGLARVAPAPRSQKHGRTKKNLSGTKKKEVENNVYPPRQTGRRGPRRSPRDNETLAMVLRRSTRKNRTSEVMNLRRSTRKRKELGYSYCEETTDEDEDEEEDEPDYPLPPIIQVPWADMEEDENLPEVPMRGLCTSKGSKRRAKRHWVSLRICASSYHRDGHKKAADNQNNQGTGKRKAMAE